MREASVIGLLLLVVVSVAAHPAGPAVQADPAAAVPDPNAPVYLVSSRETYDRAIALFARAAADRVDSLGTHLVIALVYEYQLADVSRYIHEEEGRCGGFFAFETWAEAEAFIAGERSAHALTHRFLGEYTIDNQETVDPWLAQAQEADIRATIEHLSTAWPNRYYNSPHGANAAAWIRDTWLALADGRDDVSAELYTNCGNCGVQPSVILTIEGNELPDEIVVLGAHLDSILSGGGGHPEQDAPGADDDGSGIATLTEVLRVALSSGWKPKRTVQFTGYAAEEVGLRGSRAIAQAYEDADVNVVGVLQLDMTNYQGTASVAMRQITDFSNAALQQFARDLFDEYLAPLGLTRGTYTCGYACSDHASWTENGFPSTMMFEPTLNSRLHTPNDTLPQMGGTAHVSVPFAQFGLAFLGELAKTAAEETLPALAFTPASLDFGPVEVGDTGAPQTATLHNTGNADATGLGFDLAAGDFAASTAGCGTTLAAGASCTIEVTFSPTAEGPAAAELEVTSDEGAGATLSLIGEGVVTLPPTSACVWDTTLGNPGGSLNAIGLWGGTLYAGGSPGTPFNGVSGGLAQVDLDAGTTAPLGTTELTDGFVGALVPFDDGDGERLIIAGAFNGIRFDGEELPDSRGVVAWDGSATTTLEGSPFAEPLVFAQTATVYDGRLVVGGAGGVVDPPQRPVLTFWDGEEWLTFREEFDGLVAPVVLAVAEFQGDLYFGGRFASIEFPAGNVVESMNVMGFDGEGFFSVGGGVKRSTSPISQVLALATFDDGSGEALYIGGRFDASVDDVPMFAVARWDGSQLSAVGNGFPMPSEVRDFAVYDDGSGPALYAVGNFTQDTAGQPMERIAKLTDGEWVAVADGAGENPSRALALPDGSLGFAGNFTQVGGGSGTPGAGPSNGFAQLSCLANLTVTPSGHDFGVIDPGDSASVLFTLTNQTDTAIAIGPAGTAGDSAFAIGASDGCSDTVLGGGASCQIEVVFDPAGAAGSFAGSLGVPSEANSVLALLTGAAEAEELSVTAVGLDVDTGGGVSDGNGVFEPAELVTVAPAWRNDGASATELTGGAAGFGGPAGAVYSLVNGTAAYGLVAPGATASCLDTGDCYQMGLNDPVTHPAAHWDAIFEETLAGGPTRIWTLHIGDSFTDVPRASSFYPWIETLLHHGVTGGC
ncbi:MAG: M20/M25/M40 family metallo-hydrolase, partial [Thermoanaerobaculia bacterium]